MSDKDVNIHVKADGVQETEQQFADLSRQQAEWQRMLNEGNKKVAEGAEQPAQKLSFMGRILNNLISQIKGFIVAWLGIKAILILLDTFNKKIERMLQLSKEFYNKAMDIQKVGQELEFQTGTVGQQKQWGAKALELQKAGRWSEIDTPKQLMLMADTIFKSQGGIKNKDVFSSLKSFAPTLGAAGLSSSEIDSFFQIAEKAKTPPTADALNKLFAKIRAGSAAGKMAMGEFLQETGTGTGFVNYLKGGGSLEKAIALYSTMADVSANKRTGNTLLDLLTNISAGESEPARKTVERFTGAPLSSMTMDERSDAVLKYIASLPPDRRVAILQSKGFASPTDLAKLVTPEAQQVFEASQKAVAGASAEDMKATAEAYLKSAPAKQAVSETEAVKKKVETVTPEEEIWQNRLDKADTAFAVLQKKMTDAFFIRDKLEPSIIALESMAEEAEQLAESLPKGSEQQKQAQSLSGKIRRRIHISISPENQWLPQKNLYKEGAEFSGELEQLESQNPQVNIHNDYSHHFYNGGESEKGGYNPNVQ